MKLQTVIGYTVLVYLLVFIGFGLAFEIYKYSVNNNFELLYFVMFLLSIGIVNMLVQGSTKNIFNYSLFGALFGTFFVYINDVVNVSGFGILALFGLLVITIISLIHKTKLKHPLVYLVLVAIVMVIAIGVLFKTESIMIPYLLILTVFIVPFLVLINISNYAHDVNRGLFSKNPFLIAIFPLGMFVMGSFDEVVVPEPFELEEVSKKEEDEEEEV